MTQSHIYIRDNQLPKDYDGTSLRRTTDDLAIILTEISTMPPASIKETRLGFMVFYQDDTDVNFIFKPEIQNKLQQKQLLARLSLKTQNTREVYILRTPESAYNKSESNLITEIESRNNILLLQLVKFTSNDSHKSYIKITVDSNISRDEIINKGIIHLFQLQLPAKPKYSNPSETSATADVPATAYNSSPAQRDGRALSTQSTWADSKRQPNIISSNKNKNAQRSNGLLRDPPALSALQLQANESDIKIFLQTTIYLSAALSDGIENPEVLVSNVNAI